jgi:hypothetical protein
VLGTALELLGGASIQPDADTERLIREEVGRVEAASGQTKPAWLCPAVEAIDYSRYKPRGFYTQSEDLSRYFRAVAWLQSIPFCVDHDEELLAILMLGNCMADQRFQGNSAKQARYRDFFKLFRELLGDRDDWDLSVAAAAIPGDLKIDLSAGGLKELQQSLHAKAAQEKHEPQINDQMVWPGQLGLGFRILSAHRTPDAILFQRISPPGSLSFPSAGLDVCTALGATYAARHLEEREREKVLKTIDESKGLFSQRNLYCDYLGCVSTLFDPPAAGAPAFMSK